MKPAKLQGPKLPLKLGCFFQTALKKVEQKREMCMQKVQTISTRVSTSNRYFKFEKKTIIYSEMFSSLSNRRVCKLVLKGRLL